MAVFVYYFGAVTFAFFTARACMGAIERLEQNSRRNRKRRA